MLPLPKFLKPYKDAGESNAVFAPFAFLDKNVFLNKTGSLGVVYEMSGIDPECLTDATMESNTKRLAAAFKLFHDDIRLYQYVVKQDGANVEAATYKSAAATATTANRAEFLNKKGLYAIRLYLAVVLKPAELGKKLHPAFLNKRVIRLVKQEVNNNRERLLATVQGFERSIGDLIGLRLLPKAEAFQFLRVLANLDQQTAETDSLRHDTHLDFFMTSSAVSPRAKGLEIGRQNVEVITMRETPAETFPNVFRELLKIQCNFILCTEYRRIPNEKAITLIQAAQSHHYWGQFLSSPMALLNLILNFGKKDDLVADESELDDVDELTETLKRIKNGGESLGEFSFTVVLFGEDNRAKLRTASQDVAKIFGSAQSPVIQETYGALDAALAIVPGGTAFNHRLNWLLSANYADISLVYRPSEGDKRNRHLKTDATVVFTTDENTAHHFNIWESDRFGALLFGASGAGKSMLANTLIDHSQKDSPRTTIIDLTGSYRFTTAKYDGSYVEMQLGERQAFRINPFVLPPTEENLQFLSQFITGLMSSNGDYTPTVQDNTDLFDAIQSIYVNDPEHRSLGRLAREMLPPKMKPFLQPWVRAAKGSHNRDGQFATVFDNVDDTLSFAHFQTFDFEGMDVSYPKVLAPMVEYIFQRVRDVVYDRALVRVPKMLWADECWKFMANGPARDRLIEAGKTWRQHNGGICLITQSAGDYGKSGGKAEDEYNVLASINEICPTKLLLSNPGADLAKYAELFKLNEREVELFAGLIPKRQFFLKTPTRSGVLNVELDPAAYWTYTTSPEDKARRAEMIAQHGIDEGIRILAATAAN